MSLTNSKLSLSVFICLALSASFGYGAKFKLQSRIVGGHDAVRGQFPYSVSIRDYTKLMHFCGGAIISDHHILTAAHCLQGNRSKAENLYVVVGALHREGDGTEIKVANIMIHQYFYNPTYKNDIAMIYTAEKIKFTDVVKPIALTKKTIQSGGDLPVMLSGFGRRWVSGFSYFFILSFFIQIRYSV